MRILAIGGLGFIGHHLSRSLIHRGHEVMILDNMNDYGLFDLVELKNVMALRLDRLAHHSGILKADVNEPNLVRNMIGDFKPNCIVYLAGYPRAKAVDINVDMAYQTMVTSLKMTAEATVEIGARFAFISSSMVYGEWPDHPIDEMYEPRPQGNYSTFKSMGEILLQEIISDEHLLIFRPSGVYGPYDVTDRVVSRMMKDAMHNSPINIHGENTMLDLTYIDDVTAFLSNAIHSQSSGIFNISSGHATTLFELAQKIKEVTGSSSTFNVTKMDDRYFQRGALDNSKAKIQLNHLPKFDLMSGLEAYYSWLKDVPNYPRDQLSSRSS